MGMRVPAVFAFAMMALAGGCALVAGIEDTTTLVPDADAKAKGKDVGVESAAPEAGGDDDDGTEDDDAGGPFVPPDSDDGGDAGTKDGSVPCGTPQTFAPPLPKAVSTVCDVSSVVAKNGDFTGLDCHGAGVQPIDSERQVGVTGCVALEYPSGTKLDTANITLFAIDKGCSYTCYSGGCDTKTATAHVFVGTSRDIDTWKVAGYTKVDSTRTAFTFHAPAGDYRVLGICRNGAGAQYRDLGVTAVKSTCR